MARGLLAIECEHCGYIGQYFVKEPIENHVCTKCGKETKIPDNMRVAYMNCECGQNTAYLTNVMDSMFDMHCNRCKQVVAVEYIKKGKNGKGHYVSINTYRKKGWNNE